MERRFQARLDELLDDAVVPLSLLRGALPRLGEFLQPFLDSLIAPQRANAQDYVQGLLSDLASKDAESIAYLHDRERHGLQKFIGQVEWDHCPLVTELVRQPWIIQGVMRTADAVTPMPGLIVPFLALTTLYLVLAAVVIALLVRQVREGAGGSQSQPSGSEAVR